MNVADMTLGEMLEMYPYLKELSKSMIFTTKEDIENLRNGDQVRLTNEMIYSGPMSVELLKRILQNETYYQHAYKCVTGENADFKIGYIYYGDISGTIKYEKIQIVRGLEKLIKAGAIELSEDVANRYNALCSALSVKKFLEDNAYNSFDINIEGNDYSIPISQIFSLMHMKAEEFDKLCKDDSVDSIHGVPKEFFLYAARKYFIKNKLFENLLLDDVVFDRFDDIDSHEKMDIQAINRHLVTTDVMFRKAKVDEGLEKKLLDGMPSDVSDLEKAIYIYIKMCKILTYDDEYYAVNQIGPATMKHRNIDYVSTITPNNNKVVCFEFNLIYSKLLNDLGIKFSSEYMGALGESYGDSHVSLEFRSGKFLVNADSVTSILYGDMTRAKLNQPLVGLKCVNLNEETKVEFENCVSRMYELIAKQEKQNDDIVVEHVQTFDELLEEYSFVTTSIKEVDLDEKTAILMDKVSSASMVGIDSLSYVLHLRKVLFNEEERKKNIRVSVIRNNEPVDSEKQAMASAIFTLNEEGFDDNPDKNRYYYFNPGDRFVEMSKDNIQMRFDEGTFEYIGKDDPRIPEIKEGGITDARKVTSY